MDQGLGERPWYGDWPEGIPRTVEIPEVGLSDLLRQTSQKYPEAKATVFLDTVLTYRELDNYVDRLATALADLGLVKGDVVAMMLPNSHQFVVCFYACQRIGVTATAINPMYKPMEIKHQLKDSGAKALIILDAVYPAAADILAETPVEHLIGTNIVDLCGFSAVKRFLGKLLKKIPSAPMPAVTLQLTELLETEPNPPRVAIDPRNDVAVLQYTGGTTGTPKGAMLSARNLVSNAVVCKAWLGDMPDDMGSVGVLPLFHIYAMTTVMNVSICGGGFQLLLPKPPEDLTELAAEIEKWGAGTMLIMPGVAALFNKINTAPGLEKYDWSSLKYCLSGAGPLPREVQVRFEEKTGAIVVEGFGLSESSPVTHANPFFMPGGKERVVGSCGIPVPNTDVKIMDLETGTRQLGHGPEEVGELVIKGPQIMLGYYNNPEESAQALRDGWLYTGDVAYMDERGWTFIMDRAKDLVKHKGFSVFPKEVEDYFFSHPDILEVAVVGLPHPKVGEVLKAYVVLKEGHEATAEGIIGWGKENMASYKVPSIIEFRDELPKTLVGKVLRRVLRDEDLAKMEREAG